MLYNQDDLVLVFNLIAGIHIKSKRYFESKIKKFNLTYPQYGLLLVLFNESRCSQIFLSKKLETDRTSIMVICDSLEKKKFIKREINPKNRRENIISITELGKKSFLLAREEMHEVLDFLNKGLNKSEIKTILPVLNGIYSSIKELIE